MKDSSPRYDPTAGLSSGGRCCGARLPACSASIASSCVRSVILTAERLLHFRLNRNRSCSNRRGTCAAPLWRKCLRATAILIQSGFTRAPGRSRLATTTACDSPTAICRPSPQPCRSIQSQHPHPTARASHPTAASALLDQIGVDFHPQSGPLRHPNLALLDHGRVPEDRPIVAVVADRRIVQQLHVRRVGP